MSKDASCRHLRYKLELISLIARLGFFFSIFRDQQYVFIAIQTLSIFQNFCTNFRKIRLNFVTDSERKNRFSLQNSWKIHGFFRSFPRLMPWFRTLRKHLGLKLTSKSRCRILRFILLGLCFKRDERLLDMNLSTAKGYFLDFSSCRRAKRFSSTQKEW